MKCYGPEKRWASYFTSVGLSFFIFKVRVIVVCFLGLLGELSEIIHAKHLAQFLAHNKQSLNGSLFLVRF